MSRYYIDTCIWLDLLNERRGFLGEDLAAPALALLAQIIQNEDTIIISDIAFEELKGHISEEILISHLAFLADNMAKITASPNQVLNAKLIANKRGLPKNDVLHAIMSRDSGAILVTRDRHFTHLDDISRHFLPEDLIK